MATSDYTSAAQFEHRFWLQILGDHSRFIRDALTPSETENIYKANSFVQTFDLLLERTRDNMTESEIQILNQQAFQYASNLKEFKLELLRSQLQGQLSFHLPPTFLDHMVNELDEYLRVLSYLTSGQRPPLFHPLHHHHLWLLDANGHADAISQTLDGTEKHLIEKSNIFSRRFSQFYLKSVELAGYLRTHLSQFPALTRFNRDAELEMKVFIAFLQELETLEVSGELLGTLTPLLPDHMLREECYYLTKLSQVSEVTPPNCDPGKPRIENV